MGKPRGAGKVLSTTEANSQSNCENGGIKGGRPNVDRSKVSTA